MDNKKIHELNVSCLNYEFQIYLLIIHYQLKSVCENKDFNFDLYLDSRRHYFFG